MSATHDAAAVLRGRSVLLFGGGESVSTPAVVRVDSQTAATHALHPLDEPLSDLGAVQARRQHLSRRRLHGNDVRERDPAPRRKRPNHDRRAPSHWNALRRRGDERREDLRRRRPDHARREPRDLRVRSTRRNRRPHRLASAPRGARGSGCARRTSVPLRRPVGVAHLAGHRGRCARRDVASAADRSECRHDRPAHRRPGRWHERRLRADRVTA